MNFILTSSPLQDGQDAGSSRAQMLPACAQPLQASQASEASCSEAYTCSEAYSMFALSLDNDSCRSPEALGPGAASAAAQPPKKLYMPEQKPLTHFQVMMRNHARASVTMLQSCSMK